MDKLAPSTYSIYVLEAHRSPSGRAIYYTGITCDVRRRVQQHASGKGAKCLRGMHRIRLLWVSPNTYAVGDALRLERAVKKLPREQRMDRQALTEFCRNYRGKPAA